MRLENLIIIYELKLKKFKEDYENKSSLDRVTDYHQFEKLRENYSSMPNYKENNNSYCYHAEQRQRPVYVSESASFSSRGCGLNHRNNLLIGLENNKENNLNDFLYFNNEKSNNFYHPLPTTIQQQQQHQRMGYVNFKHENYYDERTGNNLYGHQTIKNKIQRPQTSDKCIETINEIGTQTLDDDDIFYVRNSNTFSSTSIENHQLQKHNVNLNHRKKSNNNLSSSKLRNRVNRTNSSSLNSNKPEQCGKKLLLEAYLKTNNNNKSLNNETTTSENETYASEQNPFRIETTTTTTTTTTRESGVGTFNEEDIDEIPLTDDYKKDESPKHYKSYHCHNKSSDLPENIQKTQSLKATESEKSMKNLDSEISSDIINRKPTMYINGYQNEEENVKEKSLTKKFSRNQISSKVKSNEDENKSNRYFKKLLKALFMFSIFLLIIFFVLYRFLFNPVCCDLKKNYLFINYI